MSVTYCYPRSATNGKICPVSALDHVISKEACDVKYFCPSTGSPLNNDTYQLAISNAVNKVYPATDHAPIMITVDGMNILYVSLDNSVRSIENGFLSILQDWKTFVILSTA